MGADNYSQNNNLVYQNASCDGRNVETRCIASPRVAIPPPPPQSPIPQTARTDNPPKISRFPALTPFKWIWQYKRVETVNLKELRHASYLHLVSQYAP